MDGAHGAGHSTATENRWASPPPDLQHVLSGRAPQLVGHAPHGRRRKYDIAFKGVYPCRVSGGNFFQSQISVNGTTHHLGVFTSAEEAALAYDEQARLLGRRLNFAEPSASVAYGFPAAQTDAAYPRGVGMASAFPPMASAQQPPSCAVPGQQRSTPPHEQKRLPWQEPAPRPQRQQPAQEWVGVPLGEQEIAAFWSGAGSIGLLAHQGAGHSQPHPVPSFGDLLASAMDAADAQPALGGTCGGPMWPEPLRRDSGGTCGDGAGAGSFSSLM